MQHVPQVHWHEGLYLRPHHLQTMQRHLIDQLTAERGRSWSYPYGLIEGEMSTDALENSRVQYDRLRAIMPSGLDVSVPETADLPSLDIKEAMTASAGSLTVYLGVSLWSAERGNAIEVSAHDLRARKIYRVAEIERSDENSGENPQPVLVRRINARLLLEDDDRTDLEVLPLLRIARSTGEEGGKPRLVADFVPPCLVLRGSPKLMTLVRDLANQVEASAGDLRQLLASRFNIQDIKGHQYRQMLKLKTLCRFGASLKYLAGAPAATPFEVYVAMRELLGELEAVYPERSQVEVSDYDHDNLMLSFSELSRAIRALLPEEEVKEFRSLDFERSERKLVLALSEDDFSRPNEYFLRIKNGGDPREVEQLVTNRSVFKVMPESMAFKPVPGIPLEVERNPPPELPRDQYFRLLCSENALVWKRIVEEGRMAIFWRGVENSPIEITLYMTFPGGG